MSGITVWQWARDQFRTLPVPSADLTGRVVLVTGANTGLGKEAARHFARMSPKLLILAVRSIDKGNVAKQDIIASLGLTKDFIQVWELDMADSKSVKAFADRVAKLERCDLAMLNAGINQSEWALTKDGHEAILGVNGISTGLLAALLLPKLQHTATLPVPPTSPTLKPHLAIVGSDAHYFADFPEAKEEHPITALNQSEKRGMAVMFNRYAVSKLMNLFVARELGKRAGDRVVVNVSNPGMCKSDIARNEKGLGVFIFVNILVPLFARTAEVGARTLVWAALEETPQGAFTNACRVDPESTWSKSAEGMEAQRKCWEDMRAFWKEVAPETEAVTA